MLKHVRTVWMALSIVSAAGSATAREGQVAQVQQPSPIRVLADSIPGSVPPEFAADLLIQVAHSSAATKEPASWRASLYEQAFTLAGAAQEPLKRRPLSGGSVDTRSNMAVRGFRFGVDTMSLRTRAVEGLLSLDPTKAWELLAQIDLTIPWSSCQEVLAPDPTPIYSLAATLAHESTQNARRAEDNLVAFLERLVLTIHSSTQLGPALNAIQAASLTEERSQRLLSEYTAELDSLVDDDLSFSASSQSTWMVIKRLTDSKPTDPMVISLVQAFRGYLVRHLSGERCKPLGSDPTLTMTWESLRLSEINSTFVRLRIPALTESERKPIRMLPAAEDVSYWKSPNAKALIVEIGPLMMIGHRERTVAEKRTAAWTQMLSTYLAEVDQWSPSGEASETDYWHQRCSLLTDLLRVIPPGSERDGTLQNLLELLKGPAIQHFSRVERFAKIRRLIDEFKSNAGERGWIVRALEQSGEPVMQMYGRVEELLGQL